MVELQLGSHKKAQNENGSAWSAVFLRLLRLFAAILPSAYKPKGFDWSWPGRIMPAKSSWREGTRPSDFGFSRQKTSNDKVSFF